VSGSCLSGAVMRLFRLCICVAIFGAATMYVVWPTPAPATVAATDSCDLPGAPANCRAERATQGPIQGSSQNVAPMPDSTQGAHIDPTANGAAPVTGAAIKALNAVGNAIVPATGDDAMFDNPPPAPGVQGGGETVIHGELGGQATPNSLNPSDPNFVGPPAPPTESSADTMFDNAPPSPAGDIATTAADSMFDTAPDAPSPSARSGGGGRSSAPAPAYQPPSRPTYGSNHNCEPGYQCH
jgi:hypothetical protein